MQDILCVNGGVSLEGKVPVSGAKNSALPLLFATLLSKGECILANVPDLEDINVTLRLLRSFGAKTEYSKNTVRVLTEDISGTEAPYALVKALRASFWALGPLLARAGEARVSLPGGDAIGTRPVDLHLHGLTCMGAELSMEHGVVVGVAPGGLRGAKIVMDFPSVGATHNLLMAASLVPEETIIVGAAREPEVAELAKFLSLMGAEIDGIGTDTLRVYGKRELNGASYSVLGDRVEAATYLLSGAVTAGSVEVKGIDPEALRSALLLMEEMGCKVSRAADSVSLIGPTRLKAINAETAPYPGFATDMQPLFMAALTRADGVSSIYEKVFESRLGHAAEYRRFGAEIAVDGRRALITGVEQLSAAPVEAMDLRAAAGLVLIGLVSEGITQVRGLHHLDRGYDGLVEKLCSLGAKVSRVPGFDNREIVFGC